MEGTGSSRYQPPAGPEAEAEPGSRGRVLRNRLGIRRKRDIDAAEYEALLRAQEAYLQRISAETRFTAALLREMHRDWLGEIYEWAGAYRTVELSKGGFRWPPAHLVADNMARFEAGLLHEHTPCRPAPLSEVARCIAEVHAELLLIHPFREGNGRLARWLAALMAMQAGYAPPRFEFRGSGGRRNQSLYLEAVKRGYLQDYKDLAGFFREAIERRLPDPF
jgi:cell filamentation protein, protein adenylyltransferase